MPHPSHEFREVNYQGNTINSCKHCGLHASASESSNPCAVIAGGANLPGPKGLPASVLDAVAMPVLPVQASMTMNYRDLIASMSSESLRARLSEIESEAKALRIFLKAAEAKEKA